MAGTLTLKYLSPWLLCLSMLAFSVAFFLRGREVRSFARRSPGFGSASPVLVQIDGEFAGLPGSAISDVAVFHKTVRMGTCAGRMEIHFQSASIDPHTLDPATPKRPDRWPAVRGGPGLLHGRRHGLPIAARYFGIRDLRGHLAGDARQAVRSTRSMMIRCLTITKLGGGVVVA